jgi:hypothetical protein
VFCDRWVSNNGPVSDNKKVGSVKSQSFSDFNCNILVFDEYWTDRPHYQRRY